MKRLRIEISGVVQGVGFRPFLHALARSRGLYGFVRNSSRGVTVEVQGEELESFVEEIRRAAPPLSRISSLTSREIAPREEKGFSILPSRDGEMSTHISPDAATCRDCSRELLDPEDRRYLYPFINCTNCGPRYSITASVPYDRPNTTMAPFAMCPACRREYGDPADRRFHAQPNACPDCGPAVELVRDEERRRGREAVDGAIELLRQGKVVAVKGIGGYHLAVDAGNADAVRRLRERKRRSNKAFALMVPGLDEARLLVRLSGADERLLASRERPVVLLPRREDCGLPEEVAPGLGELGLMLPYSPLHELLFRQKGSGGDGSGANFNVLVMTSGNRSEEPVVRSRDEAEERLGLLADAFLHHDRGIFMRVDDSVVRRCGGETLFIRRARGYVPTAVPLNRRGPHLLACGADLKNTFCLTTSDAAVVSQHIGDMEHYETLRFFEETLENLKSQYRVVPEAVAHDLHPGYFSTRWALAQGGAAPHGVQHHWAHVASVMAERGLEGPVIGVALDGSGYGGDGTVWGGEFLLADRRRFERRAHFRSLPMPGGAAAARHPWRMALSFLRDAFGGEAMGVAERLGLPERNGADEAANVLLLSQDRGLSPLTSGAGRLFESVSALLDIRDSNTYEGEAAMALEAAAAPGGGEPYPFDLHGGEPLTVDFRETLRALAGERLAGADRARIARRFHLTVAAAVHDTLLRLGDDTSTEVVLTGGVFQNRLLLDLVRRRLAASGFAVYVNTVVPANDAGISLGQAYILRALLGS